LAPPAEAGRIPGASPTRPAPIVGDETAGGSMLALPLTRCDKIGLELVGVPLVGVPPVGVPLVGVPASGVPGVLPLGVVPGTFREYDDWGMSDGEEATCGI